MRVHAVVTTETGLQNRLGLPLQADNNGSLPWRERPSSAREALLGRARSSAMTALVAAARQKYWTAAGVGIRCAEYGGMHERDQKDRLDDFPTAHHSRTPAATSVEAQTTPSYEAK